MTRHFFLALGLLCLAVTSRAQNETDALRYARLNPYGTARYFGTAGAFGALGGDFSSLHTNPAGMAVYRRSDAGFSIGIGSSRIGANYEGTNTTAREGFSNLANAGMVASYPIADNRVERINLGVSFMTLADFDERISIEGEAMNSSLLDIYALQANGVPDTQIGSAFPFGASLAWETYLLNPIENTVDQYMTAVPAGKVIQSKEITRVGGMTETAVAAAANIGNEWYFGATLGFPSVRYEESTLYTETVPDPNSDLNNWQMRQTVEVNGGGFNMKAGVIYRPTEFIRIGASVHSPTWLSLFDRYTTDMASQFNNGDAYEWDSPLGEYNYRIRTPARAQISAAALLGKIGFVSADYEFVDYSSARLRPARVGGDDYPFELENNAVQAAYGPAHNVRVGAEVKPLKWLAVRGGVRLEQAPYTDAAFADAPSRMTYTMGAGLRFRGFYLDAGLAFADQTEQYFLYDPALVDAASLEQQTISSVVSIGFRY